MTKTLDRLDEFTRAYGWALLRYNTYVIGVDDLADSTRVDLDWWKDFRNPDWMLDAFEPEARADIVADCRDFFENNLRALREYAAIRTAQMVDDAAEAFSDDDSNPFNALGMADLDLRAYDDAGKDFALSRNGSVVGFWARGLPDGLAAALTVASRVYGASQGWLSGDENKVSLQT